MSRQVRRLSAHAVRTIAFACAAGAASLLVAVDRARAHEGHDHSPPSAVGSTASPRVVATSERYQLVGIVEGEVLVIYLDRADDNAPVTAYCLIQNCSRAWSRTFAVKRGDAAAAH